MQSGSHTITRTLARFRSFRYTLILEGRPPARWQVWRP